MMIHPATGWPHGHSLQTTAWAMEKRICKRNVLVFEEKVMQTNENIEIEMKSNPDDLIKWMTKAITSKNQTRISGKWLKKNLLLYQNSLRRAWKLKLKKVE